MLRNRHRILLAVLLVAGVICGCKEKEEIEVQGPSAQLGGRLQTGVPVSVRLWGEPCEYVYEGMAGQVIDLSVTSQTAGLDPNVRLFDPAGLEEAFDDDRGGNGNALIEKHLLASSGTYKIRIETDEDQHGEVSVILSLARSVEKPPETSRPIGTDLQTGR
jgi:hypothetical protein